MNIVYYSSDLFSEMCGVAIQSLCENNKDADDINIYVCLLYTSDAADE